MFSKYSSIKHIKLKLKSVIYYFKEIHIDLTSKFGRGL